MDIRGNQIFGLLGPNGAGKTTMISMLCGIYRPTSGNIAVGGIDVVKNPLKLKSVIGVVPQDIALYPTLTARENLNFIGSMYGLSGSGLRDRISELLSDFDLEDAAGKKVNQCSGGMKRRINLLAGIVHNPKILFLDEPTVGVDVQSRAKILDYLLGLNKSGMTLVYTSHYLEEAEKLCSTIAVIDEGRIIAEGSPKSLIDKHKDARSLEEVFLNLTGRRARD
ncbi:MAG: ABC transporter ATP-binding protein [Bacteroidetes bacterium]|nr:MAG: ABC transporter ATP-binding protein [Bacteroidota bacterium]